MLCPSAEDLVRYVSGEAGADDAARVEVHLVGCPTCAETVAALRETWAALDAWQLDASGVDLTERVLMAVEAEEAAPRRHRWRWPALTRLAASVAIAAGLGIGAGRLVSQSAAPDRETAMADGVRDEIVHTLTSAYAATDSATGLALRFEPASRKEGR
ncbi:MAG: zf-HC2 domain-containing protein [Phycisphaerae bacterium]|nr:zf-HC2 domain-containing protein [Phycisphaerae bacterium]